MCMRLPNETPVDPILTTQCQCTIPGDLSPSVEGETGFGEEDTKLPAVGGG